MSPRGPAAAWRDGEGVTSSREILGLSPSKDVGFPYQGARAFGAAGDAVDAAAMAFSWQRYLVDKVATPSGSTRAARLFSGAFSAIIWHGYWLMRQTE